MRWLVVLGMVVVATGCVRSAQRGADAEREQASVERQRHAIDFAEQQALMATVAEKCPDPKGRTCGLLAEKYLGLEFREDFAAEHCEELTDDECGQVIVADFATAAEKRYPLADFDGVLHGCAERDGRCATDELERLLLKSHNDTVWAGYRAQIGAMQESHSATAAAARRDRKTGGPKKVPGGGDGPVIIGALAATGAGALWLTAMTIGDGTALPVPVMCKDGKPSPSCWCTPGRTRFSGCCSGHGGTIAETPCGR